MVRLHLMDGSVISGRLSVEELELETPFGKLTVPVTELRSFTPGLVHHPELGKKVYDLIDALGANDFDEREKAQKELIRMGASVRGELEKRRDDKDAERRTRIKTILEEADSHDGEEDGEAAAGGPLIERDTVETTAFTAVGKILNSSFTVASLYGPLTVKLGDIRRGERELSKKTEFRKVVSVDGANLVQRGLKASSIKVERGDKVTVTADGSLTMTPWGNNMIELARRRSQFRLVHSQFDPGRRAGGGDRQRQQRVQGRLAVDVSSPAERRAAVRGGDAERIREPQFSRPLQRQSPHRAEVAARGGTSQPGPASIREIAIRQAGQRREALRHGGFSAEANHVESRGSPCMRLAATWTAAVWLGVVAAFGAGPGYLKLVRSAPHDGATVDFQAATRSHWQVTVSSPVEADHPDVRLEITNHSDEPLLFSATGGGALVLERADGTPLKTWVRARGERRIEWLLVSPGESYRAHARWRSSGRRRPRLGS